MEVYFIYEKLKQAVNVNFVVISEIIVKEHINSIRSVSYTHLDVYKRQYNTVTPPTLPRS